MTIRAYLPGDEQAQAEISKAVTDPTKIDSAMPCFRLDCLRHSSELNVATAGPCRYIV
jgi:hypothetical protein